MSQDALFQLGMGSVSLNAAQKEETFAARALKACAGAIRIGVPGRRFGHADPFGAEFKRRDESTKIRIPRAGSAFLPSIS